MKSKLLLFCSLILVSCGDDKTTENNSKENSEITSENPEELIEIVGDTYTEYYPNKKSVKFKGTQDEEGRRHGKWVYLSESGKELSMTMYEHGKKHGHSIVKYPTGAIHYFGEYENDQKIGVWKTYDGGGKLTSEDTFELKK